VDGYIMKAPDIRVYDLLMQKVQSLVAQRRAEEAPPGTVAQLA